MMDEMLLKELIVDSDKKNKKIIGSSTLCSAYIDNKLNMLYTAYIGDSLYMILRKNQERYFVFYKSPEMTHGFNFPLQLGTNGDNPKQSSTYKHELDKEDIIILASDG
jgi:serine/threonine protein phosphatase PrpC